MVAIIRDAASTPEVDSLLNRVSAALTTVDLAEMNRKVDEDKEDPDAWPRNGWKSTASPRGRRRPADILPGESPGQLVLTSAGLVDG